jgi:hypothetical protein
MAYHSNYWSCSRFADWLRGTPKPQWGTDKEWKDWHQEEKSLHGFRYWLAEEALDKIQDFVTWPVRKLYDIKYYINNRYVGCTHALVAHPSDLSRGTWHDVGGRFLPCLFGELVDFVEIELAWWHVAWNVEARKKFKSPFWSYGWFKFGVWRCPEAGLENLNWQANLRSTEDEVGPDSPHLGELTPQAVGAREILSLYNWWTEVYRKRPDAMDASGWSEFCNRTLDEGPNSWLSMINSTPELEKESTEIHKKLREIEEAYEKEDEEMLIRLVKVRHYLWT